MFDLDATGAIRPEELMQLGRQAEIGHNRGEWVQEMNAMLSNQRDTAANGLISCAEFVEHCNDLFSPSGALCRNYSGIPYSGPYAGATMHRLDEMKTELRKQIALMQPSLSALQ